MTEKPSVDQQITFIYTPDLQQSAKFYEKVLGLDLVLDQGSCRIYGITSSAYLGICFKEGVEREPNGIIITLVSSDVDGWYKFLKEKGIEFEKPPEFNPKYKIYHCFLKDPNGYLIEIQSFEDPRWNP